MQSNSSLAPVVAQVLQTLQSSANQANVPSEQLSQLASAFVQLWSTWSRQPNTGEAQALGKQFAEVGLSVEALSRSGRDLSVTVVGATAGHQGLDMLWQFMNDVTVGFVEHTKQAAQNAAIAEMQATQQREDQLRAVIQELSTPIIPIYRGVLVLPLVGAIDSMRSQEITERLLEEIVRQQADMVIIDITGVSVVDTSVANHLIMTAQAVNLLGSRVIFTGISSTIAQTIIQLGVNLGDVVTLSNLQAGMLYALEQLGLGIAEIAAA